MEPAETIIGDCLSKDRQSLFFVFPLPHLTILCHTPSLRGHGEVLSFYARKICITPQKAVSLHTLSGEPALCAIKATGANEKQQSRLRDPATNATNEKTKKNENKYII